MSKSESTIMKEIMLAVSLANHKIFRVNVGEGYLFRQKPTVKTLDLESQRARWFKTGVPQGYSDLAGVAYPSGKAVFIECKTPTGKPTIQQCAFLLAMLAAGANAGIAHNAEEALAICEMTENYRLYMGGYINDWLTKLRQHDKRPVRR